MFGQLADYMVLELIVGERVVEFINREIHAMLYVIVAAYFIHALLRYRQNKKIITLHQQIADQGERQLEAK